MEGTLNIVIRSLGALVILFVLARVRGKKQISQLSFFEYVTGITLGELAGFMSTELEAHYFHGIAAILIWTLIPLWIEKLTLHSKWLRWLFEGKETVLIDKGKIIDKNLLKEHLTIDELLEELRKKNTFRVADVEFATLEPSGEVSVMLKKGNQPLTPNDIKLPVKAVHSPHTLIQDGELMDDTLAKIGVTREWVLKELDKLNLTLDQVFFGQLDTDGGLYIDLYNDEAASIQTATKDTLLEAMQVCEAELLKYRDASAPSKDDMKKYARQAERLQQLIAGMTPDESR
ncbi:DUF421 domain-containing protein [Paenibacillus silviterrae]|uniref:DUF421 domain-containing protein n=1 Tax=Paenibacillus silviterrae TaxID=3242194 RepID=UPI002543EE32|nr:DUF421 domain-containing protein [Paenibacillus chinjuensis]